MGKFIVMESAARMPSSCWGTYRNVAVVELDEGNFKTPKMISERAKGLKRIVQFWGRLSARGKNTAYSRAMEEAKSLCVLRRSYESTRSQGCL